MKPKHFISEYPEQMEQWNWERNTKNNIFPETTPFSWGKKVWWKCPVCGYEWEATPNSKPFGKGCSVCCNKIIISGYNDLKTKVPQIAKEWDYAKNGDKTPDQFAPYSTAKVWWLCQFGHSWEQKICFRTNRLKGCPTCNATFKTSFPEQAVYFYILKLFPDAKNRAVIENKEIDIFIPSIKTGIEYNGSYFHKNRQEKDKEKLIFCKENEIRLIVLEDGNTDLINKDKIIYNKGNLNWGITQIFNLLNVPPPLINTEKDSLEIKGFYFSKLKEQSLATAFPLIAKEWDYEKNYPLTPDMIYSGTCESYWWKCEKGHNWKSQVKARTSRGQGCFKCHASKISKKVICLENRKIYNSIQEVYRKEKIHTPTIINVCKGKGKTAGGKHWKYYTGPIALNKDLNYFFLNPFKDELEYFP